MGGIKHKPLQCPQEFNLFQWLNVYKNINAQITGKLSLLIKSSTSLMLNCIIRIRELGKEN